ncbi:MAG TPA: hypothetical protein VGF30_10065 [Bacteroidia bacterium]
MPTLKTLTLFLACVALFSCGSDPVETTVVKADSTQVLSKVKEEGQLYSPFALDSINTALRTSPLMNVPKSWEMLRKFQNDYFILVPEGGSTPCILILDSAKYFVLRFQGMHDVIDHLITDCKKEGDKYIITYLNNYNWDGSNHFEKNSMGIVPYLSEFTLNFNKQRPEIMECNYQSDNDYFVDMNYRSNFKIVDENIEMKEGDEVPADSAAVNLSK